VPAAVGVPLIVNTPELKEPVTPVGNPLTFAPVPPPPILYVIGVITVLIHFVCASVPAADESEIEELAFTVMVPVAVVLLHGPVVVTV